MPIPNIPPALPMPIANSGDVNDIPVTTPTGTGQLSFQAGFPFITQVPLLAGGIAPSRPDFNAALKLLSQHTFFQQSGGFYTWQSALNYNPGNFVIDAQGTLWQALQPSGPDTSVGPKPITDTAYWRLALDDLAKYALKADLTPYALISSFSWSNQRVFNIAGGTRIVTGMVANTPNTTTMVTFPVAFSQFCSMCVACGMQAAGNTQAYVTINSFGAAQAAFNCFFATSGVAPSLSSTAGAVQIWFLAIGI